MKIFVANPKRLGYSLTIEGNEAFEKKERPNMKLFSTSIKSHKSQPESLLCEGTIEEIASFINSVNDGYAVGGPLTEADLDENGGNWGSLPDGWTKDAQFYFDTPTDRTGGFKTLEEAVKALVSDCEDYMLQS